MRVSAYYALGLGLFVCASHGAALSCGSRCGVWGFHVWVRGSSGVPLGRERGRVSVSLVFFFEAATMPERSAAHQERTLVPRVLLNERTIRHHRVNAGAKKEKHGNRERQRHASNDIR